LIYLKGSIAWYEQNHTQHEAVLIKPKGINMNHLGKILVHLDDSLNGDVRLRLAQQIVKMRTSLGCPPSDIEAVYATTPSYLAASMAYSEYSMGTVAMLLEADEQRCGQAKERFDKWIELPGPKISWEAMTTEFPGNSLLSRSWLADLLILAQHNPTDSGMGAVPRNLLANLIIDSGKPGLIVPYIGSMKSTLQNVMIAWKPTRESSRALVASIPFLQTAKTLHVVADVAAADVGDFKRRIESYLKSNGVSIKPSFHSSFGAETGGEGLLSMASDVAADMLVMGCYGHSRTREFVLGGASRTILQSMTLPILMAH
jgi:nucleotide-binding universal stress UspA family protein